MFFCFMLAVCLLAVWAPQLSPFRRRALRAAAYGAAFFCAEDDSDMKIAGASSPPEKEDDFAQVAQELEKQKSNGNLDRARDLGKKLTKDLIAADGESSFGQDAKEPLEVQSQRKLLLAFTACHTVETLIDSKMVQRAAVNSFYNTLKATQPGLYGDMCTSGAFSFYYLCVRRGADPDVCIGRTFAMLIGRENDSVAQEFGRALYLRFWDTIRHLIISMRFSGNTI